MARTAPVPNIPPIPGMCPSIAVMGGGGGPGGGGGNGAGDGSGNGPGEGDGSGDAATGDGSNAGSCGTGETGGCTNCSDNVQRGDPVDVVTGHVFTTAITDVFLPGVLSLELSHSYSSAAVGVDVGLGFGWTHSFGWQIRVRRDRTEVLTADGTRLEFTGEWPVGRSAVGRFGWLLRRESEGFVLLDRMNQRRRVFTTKVSEGCFVLDRVEDSNGNRITLEYQAGRLVRLVDPVGRPVQVDWDHTGHIIRIRVPNSEQTGRWVDFALFSYDDRGDQTSHTDADGATTGYTYSDSHLLTVLREPNSIEAHFVYDSQKRCIETWCHHPVDSLDEASPKLLFDNRTPAKGVLHCIFNYELGYTEVVDSVRVQRIFGNRFGKIDKGISGSATTTRTYDDHGHVLSHTDPLGNTTFYVRDDRGRLLSKTDALGRSWTFSRDGDGRVVRIKDPRGGTSLFDYDGRGNLVRFVEPGGAITSHRYDSRGAITELVERNGARTTYAYDAAGNLIEVKTPNGGCWRSTFDYLGRRVSTTDALGGTTHFVFTDRGDVRSVRDPEGAVTRYTWDGRGNLLSQADARGAQSTGVYGGYERLVELSRPTGEKLGLRYNREGWLTRIVNESGESHLIEYDSLARPVKTKSFDGSVRAYRYDAAGQLTRFTNGAREVTEYEYDAVGELVLRRLSNGDSERYEYDELGLVVSAMNGHSVVRLDRDENGMIVREAQAAFDRRFEVNSSYGPLGVRDHLATSLGHRQQFMRDQMGWRSRVSMDGVSVELERDATGQLVRRDLPMGGAITSEFDIVGRLVRRSAFGPGAHVVDSAAPAWLGSRPPNLSTEVAYRHEVGGEILEEWDDRVGVRAFQYDLMRRVVAVEHAKSGRHERRERYSYDKTGNLHDVTEGAAPRAYGSGNRILRKGATEYDWDDDGRLIAKRKKLADGSEATWRYTWNARGLLGSVELPDRLVVAFDYDAFSRRIRRTVRDGRDKRRVKEATHYLWDCENVVQDVRSRGAASGDPVIEERTFVFEEDGFTPFAQRSNGRSRGEVTGAGDEATGEWHFFLNDRTGAPVKMVDGRGALVAESGRDLWGQSSSEKTPIRFLGQWADDDTGLHYSRYRHYDPELGRFISYDPLGPDAGINSFIYAPNTLSFVDPFGLTHFATARLFASEEAMDNGDTPIATSRQVDSHMTRSQRERIERAGPAGSDERNSETARQRSRCHTERKICDPPNGFARRGPGSLQAGQCLEIEAESVDGSARRPPCSGCQGAMIRLSRDRNATVIYRPGMGGRMDRPFIVRNGIVEARG